MNQMILKIASLPIDYKTDIKGKHLESGKDSGDFFSTIQGLMKSVQRRSFHGSTEPPGAGLPLKDGYRFYLESLRKGLLGKGKPLNRISLKGQDLPVLKEFLYQCGLSQEAVERLLRELVENNPHGEIDLSQFFLKIAELGPPKGNIYQPITLEPSAIPYIESALRDCGLTPKEIERALSAARVEGGGLNLDKFVAKIKEISNQIREGAQAAIDQNSAHKVSIKDLITALEQMTGRSGKENQLPNDVKATIDQILERVVITEEKNKPIYSLLSLSKFRLNRPANGEEIGNKGKSVEREGLLSLLTGKGSINAKDGQQKIEPPYPVRKFRLLSDLDTGQARPPRLSPALRDDGGQALKKGPKAMDIPPDINRSTFSETTNTVKQNQVPVRGFFPAYLIDQIGKQISRSILRGERVIRLQLKPPELGVLKVEMDIKDNVLKLWMITENSSVKELLLSNAHQLRQALVEQGVKLDRFDIQINYNFDQSLANSKEGLKDGQGHEINKGPFMAEDDTDDRLSGPGNMATGDHLLDLVA